MEIFISIDGVLRNLIDKFDYHYKDTFLDAEIIDEDDFKYEFKDVVYNDDLTKYYSFHDKDEFQNFTYVEFAVEIFGHAFPSYNGVIRELNEIIYSNEEHTFHVLGLDELGKAKSATLFFLSKTGFIGNNIKFVKSKDLKKVWKTCDIWITDNETIIKTCPKNKKSIKFNTKYNKHFSHSIEINKIKEIKELCLTPSEKTTT